MVGKARKGAAECKADMTIMGRNLDAGAMRGRNVEINGDSFSGQIEDRIDDNQDVSLLNGKRREIDLAARYKVVRPEASMTQSRTATVKLDALRVQKPVPAKNKTDEDQSRLKALATAEALQQDTIKLDAVKQGTIRQEISGQPTGRVVLEQSRKAEIMTDATRRKTFEESLTKVVRNTDGTGTGFGLPVPVKPAPQDPELPTSKTLRQGKPTGVFEVHLKVVCMTSNVEGYKRYFSGAGGPLVNQFANGRSEIYGKITVSPRVFDKTKGRMVRIPPSEDLNGWAARMKGFGSAVVMGTYLSGHAAIWTRNPYNTGLTPLSSAIRILTI